MAIIHFLNVLEGDCNIIQHDSKRVTVVDVSNAYNNEDTAAEKAVKASKERAEMRARTNVPSDKVDYKQKENPDNPIDYLKKININSIFRFIITHPDMDHLDGIKDLLTEFPPSVIWDTDNNKKLDFKKGNTGYNSEDWDFYKEIRDNNPSTRRTYFAGNELRFYNDDNIKILCPTPTIVSDANKNEKCNDLSYVLLYTPPKEGGGHWKILFAGDSDNTSWEYILKKYKDEVTNIDILFAPHHGRDSGRSYDFLKTLTPTVTLFGNASSEHLAYNSYPETRVTNNQAGYIIIEILANGINIYVKNYDFARDFRKKAKRNWSDTSYNKSLDAYFLRSINP